LAAAETSENPHKIWFSSDELDPREIVGLAHLAWVGGYLRVSRLERILAIWNTLAKPLDGRNRPSVYETQTGPAAL